MKVTSEKPSSIPYSVVRIFYSKKKIKQQSFLGKKEKKKLLLLHSFLNPFRNTHVHLIPGDPFHFVQRPDAVEN